MLAREGRTGLAQACFDFLPTRAKLDLGGWKPRTFCAFVNRDHLKRFRGRFRPVSVTLVTLFPKFVTRVRAAYSGNPGTMAGLFRAFDFAPLTLRPGAAVNSIQNPAYFVGLEARFAAAARHSRLVRALRITVPAAVILAMAASSRCRSSIRSAF